MDQSKHSGQDNRVQVVAKVIRQVHSGRLRIVRSLAFSDLPRLLASPHRKMRGEEDSILANQIEELRALQSVHYNIIGDEASGEAVAIDPTRDVDDFLDFAREHDLHIRHIIETHVHADFVSGSAELKSRLEKEATIHASGLGGKDWTPPYADHVVANKDAFKIGKLDFKFHHTPGHTPEHICISLTDHSRSSEMPWVFFTGDFLFVGDVGRPDLLGPAEQQRLAHDLYGSVFGVLKEFPDFIEIFPGHGPDRSVGRQSVRVARRRWI